MKKNINKIKQAFFYMLRNNFVSFFLALIVFLVFAKMHPDDSDWFDISFFSAIILAMGFDVIVKCLSNLILNWLEDDAKLTSDYSALVRKYKQKVFCYNNANASPENIAVLKSLYTKKFNDKTATIDQQKLFNFPIEYACNLSNRNIEIIDSDTPYTLPDEVKDRFDEIIAAHHTSVIFNQLNVRVDDWTQENNVFKIFTSRTTYFNSMVTNRAMDYKWSNGLSVRELYAYGPFFPALKESNLSNHLGFNGFVESSDGYIVFVKRGKNLSIGKGTYANSVGASLKAKYALNEDKIFNEEGLKLAMQKEIKDELKIQPDDLVSFSLEKNVIAAYRDMVEGGKPQLLFYAKSKLNKQTIEQNFNKGRKATNSKLSPLLEDGNQLLWIKRDELPSLCITPEMMIYRQKAYKMVPSASACVAMLINHLIGE